jgi:hypothetical protein
MRSISLKNWIEGSTEELSAPLAPSADTLAHILRVARFARQEGFGVLSTGERLGAALALNRADWLREMDYTLAEAVGRLDGDWLSCISEAARILRDEDQDNNTPRQ